MTANRLAPDGFEWRASWLLLSVPFALLPLALGWQPLGELFWFGDEWDLLDQISREGFGPWLVAAFAENFVPLFKLLWGGLVYLGHGDYRLMIGAVWFTHALVVLAQGTLLRRSGFGLTATMVSMSLLGLAAGNIETLAWSVQWSAVLSIWFFQLGAMRLAGKPSPLDCRQRLAVAVLGAGSALCFSRGVLTGLALAALSQWPGSRSESQARYGWSARARDVTACLISGAIVAVVIATQASGNHRATISLDGVLSTIRFGAGYLLLNPFWRLSHGEALGGGVGPLLAGLLKAAVLVLGYRWAVKDQRRLLGALFCLDVGNAILLGLGRHHTGFEAAMSFRYQYASLVCTIPFLGVVVEQLTAVLTGQRAILAAVIRCGVIIALATIAAWEWPAYAAWFGGWRGTEPRRVLLLEPTPRPSHAIPGVPSMPTARGLELIAEFNLH